MKKLALFALMLIPLSVGAKSKWFSGYGPDFYDEHYSKDVIKPKGPDRQISSIEEEKIIEKELIEFHGIEPDEIYEQGSDSERDYAEQEDDE